MSTIPRPTEAGWKIRVKRVQLEVEVAGPDKEEVKALFDELAKTYLP